MYLDTYLPCKNVYQILKRSSNTSHIFLYVKQLVKFPCVLGWHIIFPLLQLIIYICLCWWSIHLMLSIHGWETWETFPKCEAEFNFSLILGPLFWECLFWAFTRHSGTFWKFILVHLPQTKPLFQFSVWRKTWQKSFVV